MTQIHPTCPASSARRPADERAGAAASRFASRYTSGVRIAALSLVALKRRLARERYASKLMEDLADLLNVSASLEEVSGYKISSLPFQLSPPLAPTASPKSSPPPAPVDSPPLAPLSSPSPSPLSSPPPARSAHNWSADEIERVLKYFFRYGPKFRRISRHMAGRSEDSVRQLLKRRGLLVPRSSPVRRRSSNAPRWTRSEDRRLLEAFETVPRHKRGSVQWRRVKAAAGLDRLPHALRNRMRRLEATTR